MTFGFESEHFLATANGQLLREVPSRFPRDGSQAQVEVRSGHYKNHEITLDSYLFELDRVDKLAVREGYKLQTLASFPNDPTVTAGFHVHFGDNKPIDIPLIIKTLDDEFEGVILCAGRSLSSYRMKPWGFEYRSLPCNVDVDHLVRVLTKLKEVL